MLLPLLQEIGDINANIGIADTADDVMALLPSLFAAGEVEFDIIRKIDASAVTAGWNHKGAGGYWAYEREKISERAADLRNWLFQRPEVQVFCLPLLCLPYVSLVFFGAGLC